MTENGAPEVIRTPDAHIRSLEGPLRVFRVSLTMFAPSPFSPHQPTCVDPKARQLRAKTRNQPQYEAGRRAVRLPRRGGFDLSLGGGFATSRAHLVNNSHPADRPMSLGNNL
jgi:hypothetical protein